MTFTESVTGHIAEVQKQIEGLSKDDFSAVAKNIGKVIEDNMNEAPYQALSAAFGVGFGLGALNAAHIKSAAIHVGKLLAFRSLSQLENQQTGVKNGN